MNRRSHTTKHADYVRPWRRSVSLRVFARGLASILITLPLQVFAVEIAAAQGSANEYEVKAAILYNLTRFVEWPSSAYADAQAPTVLCLAGHDPFGPYLASLTSKETVNGRPVQIRHIRNNADRNGCHILYVSSSERKNVISLLAALRGSSVLTVGEMAQFATRGGMVQFELEEKQVHFDINLDASVHAQLKISARLLVLAKIVKGESPEAPAG